jgi:hypothetical protein
MNLEVMHIGAPCAADQIRAFPIHELFLVGALATNRSHTVYQDEQQVSQEQHKSCRVSSSALLSPTQHGCLYAATVKPHVHCKLLF